MASLSRLWRRHAEPASDSLPLTQTPAKAIPSQLPKLSTDLVLRGPAPFPEVPPRPSTEFRRAFSASASTQGHDAVLAEFNAKLNEIDHHKSPSGGSKSIPKDSAALPSSSTSRILAPGPSAPPQLQTEILYDPYNGSTLGVLSEPTPDTKEEEEGKEEALWTHLAQIRTLQSEIASMHVAMEGFGTTVKKQPRASRPSVDDEDAHLEKAESAEMEERLGRDAEFDQLGTKFAGRKQGIDAIMAKLDALSHAVTSFNSLPTPRLSVRSPSRPIPDIQAPRAPLTKSTAPSNMAPHRLHYPILEEQPALHDSPQSNFSVPLP